MNTLRLTATSSALFLFLAMVLFSGCKKENEGQVNEVNIRIHNNSSFDFKDVFINTSGGQHNYGAIFSGDTSSYAVFEKAYRYAFVELKIEEEVFTMQPIDYVGESPISNGFYTYQLDAAAQGDRYGRLSLQFFED